jgi:hypothetical protein
VLVISLYVAGLEQLFRLASGVVIVVCLYVAGLEATMPVESGDCYLLAFCRSGAII